MKFGFFLTVVLAAIIIVIFAYPAMAEPTLPVSEFSDNASAMSIVRNGRSSTDLNLSLREIAVTPNILNGISYKKVRLPQVDQMIVSEIADEGYPSIPMLSSLIAIPDESGIEISVDYSGFDLYDNIDLAPVQPSPSESDYEDLPFTINEEIYRTDSFFPGELASAADPVIMRDIRMAQITVYPVQYNPVRRQLKIYRDLSVSISYTTEKVINPKRNRRPYLSEGFYPLYKSLLPNFDQFYSSTEVRRGGYLIIAKDMFVDSLTALAEWKHQKGYTVNIVGASEIDPYGNPSQLEIRYYIQTAYETWEIPPEYVLIVGDNDNLGYTGLPDYPYNGYSSDHRYSTVDGPDYMPDLFVGRLSVDNMFEFRVAVAKILAYERAPQMDDPDQWLRGLSIGGNVYATTPRLTVLWVRQLLLQNGFTHVDTSFRWNSGQSDPHLIDYFNDGPSIVSYRGWSGASGWYCPLFFSSDLDQIDNHNKLAVLASVACATGNFGYDQCFGEKWIRMGASPQSFKGGPAFFGSTDSNGHTRWHNPIMVGYYWGIFNEDTYHFAPAGIRGKIQLYRTFPGRSGPGQTVEQYFHTFNMLGDPELEIRTAIPVQLSVSHPQSIPLGINYAEIQVDGSNDVPIEGAVVTLIKSHGDTEEVFETEKTDESGFASFSFDATTAGELTLTVSGRNLYPYQENIPIYEDEIAIGFDSVTIDDDIFGYSSGNGNSIANPAEILELDIYLKNSGTDLIAENVSAIIIPLDTSRVAVLDGIRDYGDIPPGGIGVSESPVVIGITSTARNFETIGLMLFASDQNNNSWQSILEIPIEAAALHVTGILIDDGNNRLDPGETVQMILTLTNAGSLEAQGIFGAVSTFDDYTSIIAPDCFFGDIPAGGSGNNIDFPVTVSSAIETFNGRNANFVLHIIDEEGAESAIPFNLVVGQIDSADPAGPDDYGYYMYDNADIGYQPSPSYDWIDILPIHGGGGERIVFDNGDDDSQMITLPFDFVYYGDVYRDIIVSIDGFIAPDTTRYDMDGNFWSTFFNWSIPDPGNARAQISPFWDDLSYVGAYNGVYTWPDAPNNRFVIEWYRMAHRNTDSYETFELIITDPEHYPTLTGDSEILFQYQDIANNDSSENYASIGFESYDEKRGLEYSFDNRDHPAAAGLVDGRAIKISTDTGRGGIRGNIELADNAPGNRATVSTSTGQVRTASLTGDYWIKNIPPGENLLVVSAPGYFPMESDVIITPNTTLDNQDFDMAICPRPTDLTASEGLGNRIELSWSGVDHQDLTGYNVFRGRWENGSFEQLNTMPVSENSFIDYTVPDNDVYWYYVTAVYETGQGAAESFRSARDPGSLEDPTGIDDDMLLIPDDYFLSQNYPNPFNQSTVIAYGLPISGPITIEIYDILGRRVETALDKEQQAGYHKIIWNCANLPSGVYFARLEAGGFSENVKMVLLK